MITHIVPKIVITGKQGQVGYELQRALLPLGQIIALDRQQLDLADSQQIRDLISALKPTIIINAAAYTAVDKAETDQKLAMQINGIAPGVLAEIAQECGALFVHYSTDYVYDGSKSGIYQETDHTNPINYYGLTKLAGEQAIQATAANYLILRTSWVYGSRGANFLLTMLRLMQQREHLTVIDDQQGTPTWSRLIAEVTAHTVRQSLYEQQQQQFQSGIYHLTCSGETTWHGFAEKIAELAQNKYPLTVKSIAKIPTSAYPTPAKRPANSRISTQALQDKFGLTLPTWDQALTLCMQDLQ